MLTHDNSRTLYSMKRCANPRCDKYVSVKGTRIYHDDPCRWSHTENSRQAVARFRHKHELIASDKDVLALCIRLAKRPASLVARLDTTWQKLYEFNALLYRHGPIPAVRTSILPQIAAMRLGFLTELPATSDEAFQYIQCLQILVDLGVEHPGDVARLRHHAGQMARFYFEIGDHLNFCKAMMTYAHNWRLENRFHEARDWYTYPYNLLREYRGVRDAEYWTLLHSATRWHVRSRLETENLDEAGLYKAERELKALAERADTPTVWLENDCELTGLWGRGGRYQDRALRHHEHLEKLQKQYAFPEYQRLSSLRPKIHALLETKERSDRDQAAQIVETEFLPLYRANPHFYYSKQLEAWKTELDLSFVPPRSVYGSAILIHLPRN